MKHAGLQRKGEPLGATDSCVLITCCVLATGLLIFVWTETRMSEETTGGLSARGFRMRAPATPYLGHHFAALADPWSPGSNGRGMITFAVAENKLSYDLLSQQLSDLKVRDGCCRYN